jgi:F0F1-type ATP synthase beta subunit
MNEGQIVQVIGPVLDIDFAGSQLPAIHNAVRIPRKTSEGVDDVLVCEVQQHLGDDRVRAVAMDSTEGLVRGTKVFDTGKPISVPVGPNSLGRLIKRSMAVRKSNRRLAGRSIVTHLRSQIFRRKPRFSKQVSRLSTCSSHTPKVVRQVYSVVQALVRRS